MATLSTLLMLTLAIALVGPIWARRRRHPDNVGKLELDDLMDGQHEVRLVYKGTMVKETYVTKAQGSASGLALWQVSDGRRLVQLIHIGELQDLTLRDCDFTNDPNKVKQFTSSFNSEMKQANSTINGEQENGVPAPFRDVRIHILETPSAVPAHLRSALNIRSVKAKCKAHRRMIKAQVKAYRNSTATNHHRQDEDVGEEEEQEHNTLRRVRRNSSGHNTFFIMPGTKWCGDDNIANGYASLAGYVGADQCCRYHDLCPVNIPGFSKKFGIYNYRFTTVSHCSCDERVRRSIMHGLRFPQTKWCGPGYDSSYYHQLGGNFGADRCCRQHDLRCPYYIEAFQKKYGVVNWSIGTINHCACDERFRSCLKVARSAPADMIGNIFFNVVKTQCFVLKKEKVCKKSSWWSRCDKYGYERRAVLREPIPWQ
ncbi:uncharacterized protein LOC143035584 [Oratosquilla oratoria]|uniref:uncharacterized protein LOC143035584 n=1 Tax=Oratosquilla oratoria TaxID=337810 RepID=UPI003F76A7CA